MNCYRKKLSPELKLGLCCKFKFEAFNMFPIFVVYNKVVYRIVISIINDKYNNNNNK